MGNSPLTDYVEQELRKVAEARQTITYSQLAERIGISPQNLGSVLDSLNRQLHARGLPMLSAVVVKKQTGMPGQGFFRLAWELGRFASGEDARQFWERELTEVYRVFGGCSEGGGRNAATAEEVARTLTEIPRTVWDRVWRLEPEASWEEVPPRNWTPQAFVVYMVVAGLNDYQLKGPAERVYWPSLRRIATQMTPPQNAADMIAPLDEFYSRERLPQAKRARLRRFLTSQLAARLWKMPPAEVSAQVGEIWHEIATTMNQAPAKKTICFAVKTLAIALRLLGCDIKPDVPMPVDEHIRRMTQCILPNAHDAQIQQFWANVLGRMRQKGLQVTMVELDSLLWQASRAGSGSGFTMLDGRVMRFAEWCDHLQLPPRVRRLLRRMLC